MFTTLRTKLTVLYGTLFAAIFVTISVAVYAAVSGNALANVRQELTTSSIVFNRVWALRTEQLENGAGLLSRDYGFREAIASHDADTIRSALTNLQARLGMDLAILIGADGKIIASAQAPAATLTPAALAALEQDDGVSGAVVLQGTPYEIVSIPVMAPVTMGWVVFASKLDRREMQSLESLAALPLDASIEERLPDGRWSGSEGAFIASALASSDRSAHRLEHQGPATMALVRPLATIDPRQKIVLLLQYPVARALAPYRLLLGFLLVLAGAALVALLAGTFALARSVTAPISALEDAARRMRAGEQARVAVVSRDEIGSLAAAFNGMVEEIGQRDAERARAAKTLERARDLAEAANRAKSSFLANMSHEVRTPLNGVLGVAGVLAKSRLTAAQREMVTIIDNSGQALKRVLNDVLDLASVEAGRLEIVDQAFELGETVAVVAAAAEAQCRRKGLAFRLRLEPDAARRVLGDRARLQQILDNLLGNAVKFTAAGEVALSVSTDKDGATVAEIADTGIGFDAASVEQLFAPFQQADGSNTRSFSGSGLGLSISRELARAMGGDLTATGRPGAGATFTLRLPFSIAPPAVRSAPPAGAPAIEPGGAGQDPSTVRVLLADDHEINRTVARLIIEAAGYQLTCVEDGAQALAALATAKFDLILMDIQMPVMDGLTAIRRVREREALAGAAPTPILVVSANALPEHVAAGKAAGADGHIAKPITPAGLLSAIASALGAGGARNLEVA